MIEFGYGERISQLKKLVGTGKILLLGNTYSGRNYEDNVYPYRQDSTFLYFTGIKRSGLHLVIDIDKDTTTLYGDDATTDSIVWTGPRQKLAVIAEAAGIDQVRSMDQLSKAIDAETLYLPPYRAQHTFTLRALTGQEDLQASLSLIKAVIQLRSYKSEAEVAEMEKAVRLSNKIHSTLIRTARNGHFEYELLAQATQLAITNNTTWAYNPILTKNGQTLHNHDHHHQLADGDLVLVDAGIELPSGYCADLTRTFPVSRRFNSIQKDIYNIVHTAYLTAVVHTRPGVTNKEIHLKTAEAIVDGMKEIGWMKGDTGAAVVAGAHTLFFPHGLGHMIGMDVHDMENLGEIHVGYSQPEDRSTDFGLQYLRLGKKLESGFCLTIEPGVYLIPELIDKFASEGLHKDFLNYDKINQHRDFGGIRLEDDFLVTEDGCRRLGGDIGLPTSAEGIEALRPA